MKSNLEIIKELDKNQTSNSTLIQNVLIRTHSTHAGGGKQEFYGRFVSFTPKGGNYELKIKRKTEGKDLAGRFVYEELNFTNHNIAKIIPH